MNSNKPTSAQSGQSGIAENPAHVTPSVLIQNYDMTGFLTRIQSQAYHPVETGLPFFDDLLDGGIVRQSLLILMAAPGAGKTTLCQQIAEAMAAHGKKIIYLNFEMSQDQMLAKAISGRLARKNIHMTTLDVLQGYKWTADQKQAVLAEAADYRKKAMPFIQYNPKKIGSDVYQLQNYLTEIGNDARSKGETGPAVVIDYLHLITSNQKIDPQDLIKQIVMILKKYAIDYDTFVIAISATNRESTNKGRISLTSGRDSSNLEYTADYQLSLNYHEIEEGNKSPNNAKEMSELQKKPLRKMVLRVLKNRSGMAGKEEILYFNAAENYFYRCADRCADEDMEEVINDSEEATSSY